MSLDIVNVSKRIKDRWVLRDVSFELREGEVFGLFGPSGSGKSTLLEIISGGMESNGGAVKTAGTEKPVLLRSRYSADSGSIWKRIFGGGRNTTGHADLTQAFANPSSAFLLDDPLRGLDAAEREQSISSIRKAASERGAAILFASNDYTQVMDVCDRVAVIVRGEIKQIGTPEEIYEHPQSRIVAEITCRNNLFAARRLTSSNAEMPEFYTIDGGHRLFAQRIERSQLGALNQNVTLAIRPEHVSLSFGASFPEDNLLRATVTKIRFRGPTTLVELDADGLKLEAIVLRLVGLAVGDECMVGLPPDRILILKD